MNDNILLCIGKKGKEFLFAEIIEKNGTKELALRSFTLKDGVITLTTNDATVEEKHVTNAKLTPLYKSPVGIRFKRVVEPNGKISFKELTYSFDREIDLQRLMEVAKTELKNSHSPEKLATPLKADSQLMMLLLNDIEKQIPFDSIHVIKERNLKKDFNQVEQDLKSGTLSNEEAIEKFDKLNKDCHELLKDRTTPLDKIEKTFKATTDWLNDALDNKITPAIEKAGKKIKKGKEDIKAKASNKITGLKKKISKTDKVGSLGESVTHDTPIQIYRSEAGDSKETKDMNQSTKR